MASKKAVRLSIVFISVILSLLIVVYLNQNILPAVPILPRMVLLIAAQWIILIVPAIMMKQDGTTLSALGFSKQNVWAQVLVGLMIALAMSLVLTVVPILFGLKSMVGSTQYVQPWQFAYKILGVALVEEIVFRGYVFQLLLDIKKSTGLAIIVSSLLFGFIHIIGGNIIQVVMTALIGALFCFCRLRIRNCSLLSLIIAHGVYDGLITLWVGLL